jgi:hypothetical protein
LWIKATHRKLEVPVAGAPKRADRFHPALNRSVQQAESDNKNWQAVAPGRVEPRFGHGL